MERLIGQFRLFTSDTGGWGPIFSNSMKTRKPLSQNKIFRLS